MIAVSFLRSFDFLSNRIYLDQEWTPFFVGFKNRIVTIGESAQLEMKTYPKYVVKGM